jgi:hypothetical protein
MKIITKERFVELVNGRIDEMTPGEVRMVKAAAVKSGLKCEVMENNDSDMIRKTEIPSMKSWFTEHPEELWPNNLFLDFGSITLDIYKTEDDYYPVYVYWPRTDRYWYKLCDGLSEVCALVRSITDH